MSSYPVRVEDLQGKDYSFSIKQTAHGITPASSHFKVSNHQLWHLLLVFGY